MAATALTVTTLSRTAGVAPPSETTADVANGNVYANTDTTFLLARNNHGSAAKTVTIDVPGTIDGQAPTDRVYSIPATESRYLGPFPVSIYGTAVNVAGESTDIKLTALRLSI